MADKSVVVRFDNKDYLWHNHIWSYRNMAIATSLSQKLSVIAFNQGLLSKEDLISGESYNEDDDLGLDNAVRIVNVEPIDE